MESEDKTITQISIFQENIEWTPGSGTKHMFVYCHYANGNTLLVELGYKEGGVAYSFKTGEGARGATLVTGSKVNIDRQAFLKDCLNCYMYNNQKIN